MNEKKQFEEERKRYNFKCECHDCAFYDAKNVRCTHGYPTIADRRLTEESPLVDIFCKEFTIM